VIASHSLEFQLQFKTSLEQEATESGAALAAGKEEGIMNCEEQSKFTASLCLVCKMHCVTAFSSELHTPQLSIWQTPSKEFSQCWV